MRRFLASAMRYQVYYIFVHTSLRLLAFSKPVQLLDALESPRCQGLLAQLLQNIDDEVGNVIPRTFEASDIKISCMLLKNRPCAILQMPPPERLAEAFFVAIWSRHEWEELCEKGMESASASEPLIHYFTLERPHKPTRKSPTVFCRWNSEGVHQIFGVSPKSASYEEFVRLLEGFKEPRQREDFRMSEE